MSLSQIEMSTHVSTESPPHTPSLTSELAKVLGRIGRGLRYHTRAEREALDLTHSEAELLRLVDRAPGIASNSVSTLVKQLNRAGLVERATDPLDGRAVCLRLTPLAREWVTQVGNAREQAIQRALLELGDEERETLEAALPAIKRLAKALSNKSSSPQ